MSKTAAEMLRERTKLSRGHVFTERESLALAAVLDAADAMRATVDWKPYSDDFDAVEAQDREFQRATAAYDAARAALAEALKEGR